MLCDSRPGVHDVDESFTHDQDSAHASSSSEGTGVSRPSAKRLNCSGESKRLRETSFFATIVLTQDQKGDR